MTDDARSERNLERLQECHPVFRSALSTVLANLQAQGFRPRIQEAWRSEADELIAVQTGHSHLSWGFHNATNPDGTPAALAADVLDDDHPLNPTHAYVLALAREAAAVKLSTGILWGLPEPIRSALRTAIATKAEWTGKLGWDDCHVEVTGITVAQAHAGQRPPVLG